MRSRLLAGAAVVLSLLVALLISAVARAAAPDGRLLPLDQYTTEKGRQLAQKYEADLRTLFSGIYHCIPWLEVEEHGIGFYKPRHPGANADDSRYLSIRVFIEQESSPEFERLKVGNRAAAMYSRYVVPLLRRMTRSQALTADPTVEGFTIILDWLKQSARSASDRPVQETIAVFIDKSAALDFLSSKATALELAGRAKILLWDGEKPLGTLRVTQLKDDDFVSTYKVKNYQLDPGVTCP